MGDAQQVELPAGLVETLAAQLEGPDVLGIALGGSFARGAATPLSDVDLMPFYREGALVPPKQHFYRDGWLVSIAPKSLSRWRAQMARPEWAIYLVPSAARLRLLRDRDGALAVLVAEARAFEWAPLQPAADAFAVQTLVVEVEHAQKLLAALLARDTSELCRGLEGLLYALPWAVATQRGVMVTSGNTFYAQVQAAAGQESAWSRALRAALGIGGAKPRAAPDGTDTPHDTPRGEQAGTRQEAPPSHYAAAAAAAAALPADIERRGVAGLRLYAETARLLEDVVRPDEASVARELIALAGRMGLEL